MWVEKARKGRRRSAKLECLNLHEGVLATSSFLFLVVRPKAPSSALAPSSDALNV